MLREFLSSYRQRDGAKGPRGIRRVQTSRHAAHSRYPPARTDRDPRTARADAPSRRWPRRQTERSTCMRGPSCVRARTRPQAAAAGRSARRTSARGNTPAGGERAVRARARQEDRVRAASTMCSVCSSSMYSSSLRCSICLSAGIHGVPPCSPMPPAESPAPPIASIAHL